MRRVILHMSMSLDGTYQEEMTEFWPGSSGSCAALMNDIPKIVLSRSLADDEATWPTTRVACGDLATEIAVIKDQPGADVVAWGGAAFARSLVAADLGDEYGRAVQPVAVGRSDAVYGDLAGVRHLDLVDARSFSSGVLVHVYRPRPAR